MTKQSGRLAYGVGNTDMISQYLFVYATDILCALQQSFKVVLPVFPESDLKEVKNEVVANVFGVPLPFIGVDGNSVCNKIETEGGEKASCPLKAGVNYVYKDSFPVESFYPSIDVKVHWALVSRANNKNKEIICFEVPARIK